MISRPAASALLTTLLVTGVTPRLASVQTEAQLAKVEISLSPKAVSSLPPKGAIIARPEEGKGEPIRLAVPPQENLSLMLPSGTQWEISAELPGFWVPRKTIVVGSPEQPFRLSLDLWPMGKISGLVKVKEKGVALPKQLHVKTLAVPAFLKRPPVPPGAMSCPVDEKGAWSCSLPAAAFDLVISAPGLTPQYRWGVKVPAGKTLPLGTLVLERGASVAGWVAVEGGGIDGQCIARLALLVAGGTNLKVVSDLERISFQREVRKDGFFQLTGLAPGTYTLEVQQPGFPPTRLSPVRVDPGSETFISEPLVLRQALDLQFEIDPPLDWTDRPWHARVVKRGEHRPAPVVFDGGAGEDGRFTVRGQSSGRFEVNLKDSLGNSLYSGEHSVEGSVSAPQAIEVRFVTVEGKVRLGTEPLAAVLWFGGRSGAISSKIEADEEGRFHGVLPREGLWRIQVEAAMPGFPSWTRADVRAGRSGKASLEIILPDTRVFGRVVDEQRKPVPAADLTVQSESLDLWASADAEGSFEVRGLPEGPVWLAAESSSRVTDRVVATLVEGRAAGPIELRFRQTKRLRGTVVSSRGPIAGSRVLILSRSPDPGGGVATTGADGTFDVEVPKATSRIAAIISAPGFALRAVAASAEDESLTFQVTEEQGFLDVRLPLTGEEFARENLTLAVFQNGLPLPTSLLNQWAFDHGQPRGGADQTFRVPNVAPGDYRVCLLSRQQELMLAWSEPSQGPGCDSGFLASGATLTLKPPRP
jgi:hypothetical protein